MERARFFEVPEFESPIVLYEGPARLHTGDKYVEGVGQLRFEWRRTPGVRWDFASAEVPDYVWSDEGRGQVQRFEPLAMPDDLRPQPHALPWVGDKPGMHFEDGKARYGDSGTQPHGIVLGSSDGFTSLEVLVLNYVDQVRANRPTLDVEVDGWHLVMTRTPRTSNVLSQLKARGGFGCTHVAHISRTDGTKFGFSDVEETLDTLWHLASFAAGALVGLALPVGLDDDGRAMGIQQRATSVDTYRGRLSWLDEFHVHEVATLFHGWIERSDDPFWRDVLRRAVRLTVSANRADPTDVSIVTALSCLELLAWAALQVDLGWLDLPRDGQLTLTGRLRLLLRWANIDPAIPEQLTMLGQLSASDSNIPDGPAAIAWVRNRSVHPPKAGKDKKPGWATPAQLIEAWRLALQYCDLVILRLLGYNSDYGSRLHIEGRWTGTVERVPWAAES